MTITNWTPVPSVFAITNAYVVHVVTNFEEILFVKKFVNWSFGFAFLALCFLLMAFFFSWSVAKKEKK